MNNLNYGQSSDTIIKMEIVDLLCNFPFNTALAGFSMLLEAIEISLKINQGRLNMTKDVYSHIARSRAINENSVEKAIKTVIDSIGLSSVASKELSFPSMIVKNALLEGKPKHFIMAMAEVIKLRLMRRNQ